MNVVHTLMGEDDGDLTYEYVTAANADVLADQEGARVVLIGHSHGPSIHEIPPDGQPR